MQKTCSCNYRNTRVCLPILVVYVFMREGVGKIFHPFDLHAYYFSMNDAVNHSTAEKKCAELNATLAIVNAESISNFLQEKINEFVPERNYTVAQYKEICKYLTYHANNYFFTPLLAVRTPVPVNVSFH